MSYTHLTKTELVFIEEYHEFGLSGRNIARKLKRGHEAIYRVIRQLKKGLTAMDFGSSTLFRTLAKRHSIKPFAYSGLTTVSG